MESVQCHLGGRFSERLGSQGPDHLTRVTLSLLETGFNFSNQPLERFVVQAELFRDVLCAQG